MGVAVRRPLFGFYLTSFAVTWSGFFLGQATPLLKPIFFLGPALSAIMWTGFTGGIPEVRCLLARLIQWREPLRWYSVALFGFPALGICALVLHRLLGGVIPGFENVFLRRMIPRVLGNSPLWLLILPAFVFLLLANFEEELGWRGYALPQIQARSGAVVGSLIVGVLWGVWHLPLFLDKDAIQGGIPFGWFMLSVISISVVMTWIYNNTAGSLLLATITHASTNLTTIVLPLQPPLTGQRRPLLIYFVLTAAAAIVVIAFGGLRRASKQT